MFDKGLRKNIKKKKERKKEKEDMQKLESIN